MTAVVILRQRLRVYRRPLAIWTVSLALLGGLTSPEGFLNSLLASVFPLLITVYAAFRIADEEQNGGCEVILRPPHLARRARPRDRGGGRRRDRPAGAHARGGGGLSVALYVLYSFASLAPAVEGARDWTAFGHALGYDPLTNGLQLTGSLVLLAVTAVGV